MHKYQHFMAENNILDKLDGLVSRFEEVSTLITDPNVIGDQKRYVKLTKEYKDLEHINKRAGCRPEGNGTRDAQRG